MYRCARPDNWGGGFNTYEFLWSATGLTTWVNDNPTPCTDLAISGGPFNKGFELDYVRIWL